MDTCGERRLSTIDVCERRFTRRVDVDVVSDSTTELLKKGKTCVQNLLSVESWLELVVKFGQ
jgi:hypothetical protein